MSDRHEVDWTAVELDFRAGVLPVSAIAKKFGLPSASQVHKMAQKYMWERKPLNPLDMKVAHGVASTAPDQPKFGMDSNLSLPDLTQAAILTASEVLITHRKDVKKLREMSGKFADALSSLFDNFDAIKAEDLVGILQARMQLLSTLVGEKTPVDMLEALSRVMTRLVQIERQAYGLDVMPNPDPGAEVAGEAVRSEVDKLWQQLRDVQKEKTTQH